MDRASIFIKEKECESRRYNSYNVAKDKRVVVSVKI
jgi:hypothetical protein